MTNYRKYTPKEIAALAEDLNQQLSERILTDETMERFKFRGPGGKTWTVVPESGEWYLFTAGSWQPADPPDQPLDGSLEILDLVALPLSPRENQPPEEPPPTQAGEDFLQMIEDAVRRVRESYASGQLNSGGAEVLLRDLCLLDPAGLIWACGMHSGKWYFFREEDWQLAEDQRPDPKDFETKPTDEPLVCSSCGTSLNGGKFCSECGTPAPEPEPTYSQAAKKVVERFTKVEADPFPEPVVPVWEPAPGFPEMKNPEDSPPAEPVLSPPQPEWQLRISDGDRAGESFPLGEHSRVGRKKTNQIVLDDGQCSLVHAEIQKQDDGYLITDQDSTNGTMVNGERIESPTNLHPGDTISIGDTKLVVEEGEVYPETIIRKRPLTAESKPGIDQPESSDAPPDKRNRNVILVFVLVFVFTCLCCFSIGLGGYFLTDNQGLRSLFDSRVVSQESFPDSLVEQDSGSISPAASPAPTDLPPQITDPFGLAMMLVPAGDFEMGDDADVLFAEFQALVDPEYLDYPLMQRIEPKHTVTLDDFYIDQYEITNAHFAEFLNEMGNQQEAGVSWLDEDSEEALLVNSGGSWQPREGYADHPVVEVSWYGARAYCRWRGARLPSEAEWEKAARGTDARLYPWGNKFEGDHLNSCDRNCPWPHANPDLDDGYARTAPVSMYSQGASPYGVYNLVGNVSEWTSDWLDVYPGGDPDVSEFFGRTHRVIRGGAWSSTGAVGTTYRARGEPDQTQGSIGFRCSRSP